jgi:hypothetical protein
MRKRIHQGARAEDWYGIHILSCLVGANPQRASEEVQANSQSTNGPIRLLQDSFLKGVSYDSVPFVCSMNVWA